MNAVKWMRASVVPSRRAFSAAMTGDTRNREQPAPNPEFGALPLSAELSTLEHTLESGPLIEKRWPDIREAPGGSSVKPTAPLPRSAGAIATRTAAASPARAFLPIVVFPSPPMPVHGIPSQAAPAANRRSSRRDHK